MQLMQDPRSALRLFRSSPRFTVAALVTIALGVGCNTAIFSLVDAALLRPLPYPNPDRLVRVYEIERGRPNSRVAPSYANFLDWRELGHVFSHLATFKSDTAILLGGPEPERFAVPRVTSDYFAAMRIPLRAGRTVASTDRAGATPVTVINETAARRYFGAVSALGRRITMGDDIPREVVGIVGDVRHQGQASPVLAEMYVPHLQGDTQRRVDGREWARSLTVVIRPYPGDGSSLATAIRKAAQSVGPPALVRRIRTGDEWLALSRQTPRQRTLLLGLLGSLGLLLAIVGVFGVTAYAVARRTQEIGIRLALGAGPADVVRAMVTDAAAPVVVGVAVGLGAAAATTRVVRSYLFEVTPSDPIAFAAAAACLGGFALVAAWVPARRAAAIDPMVALRTE